MSLASAPLSSSLFGLNACWPVPLSEWWSQGAGVGLSLRCSPWSCGPCTCLVHVSWHFNVSGSQHQTTHPAQYKQLDVSCFLKCADNLMTPPVLCRETGGLWGRRWEWWRPCRLCRQQEENTESRGGGDSASRVLWGPFVSAEHLRVDGVELILHKVHKAAGR